MRNLTQAQAATKLNHVVVSATEVALHDGGIVPPPTVHLLCDGPGLIQYAGFVQCRSFYQGDDAHQAIVDLALAASIANASRLIVAWEQADLQVALQLPGPPLPTGLAVLDVPRDGEHVVVWHPAELVQTGTRPDGLPVVTAEWGPARRIVGGRLPAPVAELLELWRAPRTWSDTDLMNTYLDLEDEGYRMRWTQPPDDAPVEEWPRWRRVVEAVLAAQDQT